MDDQSSPKKDMKRGLKKHGGLYSGAVIAEERDHEQQDPDLRQRDKQNRQTVELKGGERVSDGQHEDYTSNTASELNRQPSKK